MNRSDWRLVGQVLVLAAALILVWLELLVLAESFS